jgi:hypothetical protein
MGISPLLMGYVLPTAQPRATDERHTMTTMTTYATLAAFQKAALADESILWAGTAKSWGGSIRRGMTIDLHKINGACIYCGGMTNVYGETSHPDTATLATLIPCTLIDEDGGIQRAGYVAGNVAIAHSGCVAAANAYGVATGMPVVMLADAIHPSATVLLTLPSKRKATSASADPDAAEALRLARVAAGLPF